METHFSNDFSTTQILAYQKTNGSFKFSFDIEAYKKQSEIEEKYIVNRFRERRQKIVEDQAPRSKRKYFKRDHVAENQRLIDDYFPNQPTYDDAIFRR